MFLPDVIIQLSWTPSGASAPVYPASTLAFDVDFPYNLTPYSSSGPTAVANCAPSYALGTVGWWNQFQWQMYSFFGVPLIGMSFNENFDNEESYQFNNWPEFIPNGVTGVYGISILTDNYCFANQDGANPPTEPPQSPLTTSPVDSATQFYNLGSATVGGGVTVQTQTLTRYVDHATVTAISR
jgi:hypothetical protein